MTTPTTCQHCQEALASKRAKQCPACATIKNDAHRHGTYAATMAAFEQASRDGRTGQAMRDFVLGKTTEAVAENHRQADHWRTVRETANRERSVSMMNRNYCPHCKRVANGPSEHDSWCEFGIAG